MKLSATVYCRSYSEDKICIISNDEPFLFYTTTNLIKILHVTFWTWMISSMFAESYIYILIYLKEQQFAKISSQEVPSKSEHFLFYSSVSYSITMHETFCPLMVSYPFTQSKNCTFLCLQVVIERISNQGQGCIPPVENLIVVIYSISQQGILVSLGHPIPQKRNISSTQFFFVILKFHFDSGISYDLWMTLTSR